MAQGLVDSSFRYHLETARKNGITRTEIAEILTHAAFYAGWPKAWAAFRMSLEIWKDDAPAAETGREAHQKEMIFPIGDRRTTPMRSISAVRATWHPFRPAR